MSTFRNGDSEPVLGMSDVPRNRRVKCNGRSVIRHDRKHPDPELRGQPILDDDGARQYKPCEAYAAHGTEYCSAHGGNAPQAINAAKRGIALATPNAFEVLKVIAEDERVAPETRIKAAAQILDRGGVRSGVDVSLETPGWQKLMGEMFGTEADSSTQDDTAEPGAETARAFVETAAKQRKAARPVAPTPVPEETKRVAKKAARPKTSAPARTGKPKTSFEGWE